MTAPGDQPRASEAASLDPVRVRRLVEAALAEDIGDGDRTTSAVVPAGARAKGSIVAREDLVVCGLPFAREAFLQLDPRALWREIAREGEAAASGATLAVIEGSGAAILTAERTALNFLQRLSGIASLARRAALEVTGTGAVILDTRKTTPTLRDIEKYAVRVGGARNHRSGLYDAVLVKDNHIALAGGIREAIARARRAGVPGEAIEIETDDLDGVREALAGGAGRILLDNFSPGEVVRAVSLIAGRAEVEVSGGLVPGRLRAFAESGAHYLSIGRLTHSAPAADIALDVEALR